MRALRTTLIVAVVLGVLFVGADRLAVHFAESEGADRIRSSQGLPSAPELSINGFPFLTQVMDKRLDDVDISLSGITARASGREIAVTEVTAQLTDVTIGAGYTSARAERAEGAALISYEDLTKAAPKGAVVEYAGASRAAKNQVKVTGSLADVLKNAGVSVLGPVKSLIGDRAVSTYSTVEVSGGDTVRLKAVSLPDLPMPGLDDKLRDAVDYDLTIEGMPAGIRLDRLTASEDGLKIMGAGKDVVLAG